MPKLVSIRFEAGTKELEVGCYGTGDDWLCRIVDPSLQPSKFNDAYYPASDLGFLWFRESDHQWLASGMLAQSMFPDADMVDNILHEIMKNVIHVDDQVSHRIELVIPSFTKIASGEEDAFFQGGEGIGFSSEKK